MVGEYDWSWFNITIYTLLDYKYSTLCNSKHAQLTKLYCFSVVVCIIYMIYIYKTLVFIVCILLSII